MASLLWPRLRYGQPVLNYSLRTINARENFQAYLEENYSSRLQMINHITILLDIQKDAYIKTQRYTK